MRNAFIYVEKLVEQIIDALRFGKGIAALVQRREDNIMVDALTPFHRDAGAEPFPNRLRHVARAESQSCFITIVIIVVFIVTSGFIGFFSRRSFTDYSY